MSKAVNDILKLASLLEGHLNITHWAVSMRLTGKGDYLLKRQQGRDTGTATAERVFLKFSEIWPVDLAWPEDIPRPEQRAEPQKAAS